jgi:hypothetical protein
VPSFDAGEAPRRSTSSLAGTFIVSAWRRRALETFPELRAEFEPPNVTLYDVFSRLIQRCRDAHNSGDDKALSRIYGFAEWCARQSAKELWNPAGVSFYEHLADSPVTLAAIPRWVARDVFEDISELLVARIGLDKVAVLRSEYGKSRGNAR